MTHYTINRQTPGPLFHHKNAVYWFPPGKTVADGYIGVASVTEQDDLDLRDSNARLLAAAYTAFDKAGRELGLDAAELAEAVDIAGMIRALAECKEVIRNFRGDRLPIREPWVNETFDAACAVLAKLPKPEPRDR